MHRALFPVVGVLGTSSLMLVDSAIKGAVLLLLAALVTLLLRRDSAASRPVSAATGARGPAAPAGPLPRARQRIA